jgi:hypothetical protein
MLGTKAACRRSDAGPHTTRHVIGQGTFHARSHSLDGIAGALREDGGTTASRGSAWANQTWKQKISVQLAMVMTGQSRLLRAFQPCCPAATSVGNCSIPKLIVSTWENGADGRRYMGKYDSPLNLP